MQWSDQRFNLQDEESRIPRYVYGSQLRLAHRAHPRFMHRRRYLHLRGIHFSKLERLLWTHKKSLALQRVLHTHKERLPLQRETCFSTPAFIDALIIPYHHSSSINSIPYRVMLVAMRIIFLGTEMRMLITSYEISIKTEAKRHDGPPHLGTYG